MNECDTLLMVGNTLPYAEFLPADGQARAVQIDINPRNVSMRVATEVNLIGDSAGVLRRLLAKVRAKTDPDWRERIELDVRKWWRTLESTAKVPASRSTRSTSFASSRRACPMRSWSAASAARTQVGTRAT
jgi:pyruvate dehydrogenase (quinone)